MSEDSKRHSISSWCGTNDCRECDVCRLVIERDALLIVQDERDGLEEQLEATRGMLGELYSYPMDAKVRASVRDMLEEVSSPATSPE